MDLNGDETHVPFYALWVYNEGNPGLNRRLAYTGGTGGRCEQADPTSSGRYSGWRITQEVLDHLDLESQDQAVLRVKVKWVPSVNESPCQAPIAAFLDDFDQVAAFDEDYPELFADSAGIGGQSGEAFEFETFSVEIQGANPATVYATTGSVNFQFNETHGGSLAPSRLLWRWRDGSQYWHDGAWGSDDSFKDLNGSGGDPLVARWHWDETTGVVAPVTTGAEPFTDLTTAFFEGTNSRNVIVETIMVFDNGGEETELPGPPLDLDLSLNLPDFEITDFSLDAGSGETTAWHTAQGGLPDFTFTIDTTSPVAQDVTFSLQREGTPLECGTLSSLAGNLFAVAQEVNEHGNVRFILTADATSGLATHLNNGTGVFTLTVGPNPCEAGTVPLPNRRVTITVNPGEGLLIRVHFRDHLGSSVISKAFSSVFEGSEAGQPMVLDLGDAPIHLYPRPTERHHYDPFGHRLGNAGNEDNPRYTDHEFDLTTGFNYMKGRFQLPDRAKFNRPDPMRDWNWLNPQSLNLYQYTANDPINGFDPDGFGWLTLSFKVAKASYKAGERLLKGRKVFDRVELASDFYDNIQDVKTIAKAANGTASGLDAGLAVFSLGSELFPVSAADIKGAGRFFGSLRGGKKTQKRDTPAPENSSNIVEKTTECFIAGTLILTRDGLVPIEEIKAGDWILSKSDETGEIAFKQAFNPIITFPTVLFKLRYEIDDEDYELITTADHPFWTLQESDWVEAKNLKIGSLFFVNSTLPKSAELIGIQLERALPGETFTTFNFGVLDFHTYFVVPVGEIHSNDAVWVHNNECPVINESSRRRAMDAAQNHAQVPRSSRGGQDIGFDELNSGSRGKNAADLQNSGATNIGRRDPKSPAKGIDHPDGHPDLTGPNNPSHHDSPHVHGTNKKRESIIVTYPPKE